ncbi:MAG: heterodisulfide reductase-related iron-sulfur binding cluster [Anaerolineae bacterium]
MMPDDPATSFDLVCTQPRGPLRPTFCNVPPWAEHFLYVASALAILIFAYGIWRHYRVWRAGQSAPSRNTGHVTARLRSAVRDVLGQRRTVRRTLPAIFHSGVFYGFGLLFIGTVLATIDFDGPLLLTKIPGLAARLDPHGTWFTQDNLRFLRGGFYLVYEAVLDAAGLALLIGLVIAMWRRYVRRPHHVLAQWDFVLLSLLVIDVTGFVIEGLRLTFAPVPHGAWSFAGYGLAQGFVALGLGGEGVRAATSMHLWLWLFHAAASLAFIALLPYTNAVHIVSTSANLVMKPIGLAIGTGAALQPIDLETAEFFGVGKLSEFTWKQRLGFDACVRCGRCETVCPAFMAGTPLNPKSVILSLGDALRAELDAPAMPGGEAPILVGDGLLIDPAALFSCTTCMACVEVCPAEIEIVDDIVDMRRYLTLSEGALPGTTSVTARNMGTAGNPWGYAPEDRTKWAEGAGVPVPIAQAGEHYDALYWVGCSGSYDKRNQKIAQSLAQLMHAAGLKFAIMAEESCTCESARRLGEEYLYQTATNANVENMRKYTFDRIVCHCPHCFNTIKNEFPQFGGDFEVIHHSQLLEELLNDGRLKVPSSARRSVAFHDSCYLGRYNGEYDAPRASLAAAGVDVIELPRSKENGLCCGGGGGQMWFEGFAQKGVNVIRLEEIVESGADRVAVACPYCLTMLDSARGAVGGAAEGVKVMDVAEVLAEALAAGNRAVDRTDPA